MYQSGQSTYFWVFLSSTNDDWVRPYREAAKQLLLSEYGEIFRPLDMKDFGTGDPSPPIEVCKQSVMKCRIYIGIFGSLYGSCPPEQPDQSYTEVEFTTAAQNNLLVMAYLLSEEVDLRNLSGKEVAQYASGIANQNRFRSDVKNSGKVIDEGSESIDDFLFRLRRDLRKIEEHLKNNLSEGLGIPQSEATSIPIASDRRIVELKPEYLDQTLVRTIFEKLRVQQSMAVSNEKISSDIWGYLKLRSFAPNGKPVWGVLMCLANEQHLRAMGSAFSLRLVEYDHVDKVEALRPQTKDVYGNLLTLYQEGWSYLLTRLNRRRDFTNEGIPSDELEIPRDALREAFVNALVHRDYADHLENPTRIEIFPNRVELTSYGRLPSGISIEKFKEDPDTLQIDPHRRNSVLVEIFIDMELMESDARGVRRILRSCERAGLRLPQWIEGETTVKVIFWRPEHRPMQVEAVLPRRDLRRPSKYDVFISYARSDGLSYAKELEERLMTAGFRTWRDVRRIDPAHDFSAEIEIAIENAAFIVVCLTPDTKRADSFVRREIQYALALRKPVFPLRFTEIQPPISIINNEWIDFFRDSGAAFHRLTTLLRTNDTRTIADELDDLYKDYLNALYKQIIRYLDITVFTQLITLGSADTPEAVTQAPVLPLSFFDFIENNEARELHFSNLNDVFDYSNGKLLLLGEPGAGKTTTLFAFARDRIVQRLSNPVEPLPLLARIATWDAQKQESLADWISRSIPALGNDVPKLLNEGRLLLLLDGLDELGKEQIEFVEMLFNTPSIMKNQIVISSRLRDYFDLDWKLPLNNAVTLQQLSDIQIKTYLRDEPMLMAALDNDIALKEAVRTPLILSLFTIAFRDAPEDLIGLGEVDLSAGDIRDRVFLTFLERRYKHEQRRSRDPLPFELAEFIDYLGEIIMRSIGFQGNMISNSNMLVKQDFVSVVGEYAASELLELCLKLQLLTINNEDVDIVYRFTHLQIRNTLVFGHSLRSLQSVDGKKRMIAATVLASLQDTRAVEPLITILNDTDEKVAQSAAEALTRIGTPEALAAVEAWRAGQAGE